MRDDSEQLQQLLSGGCLTQEELNEGLLRGCLNGCSESVGRLIRHGAEIDCEDMDGQTPLMLAAPNGHKGQIGGKQN